MPNADQQNISRVTAIYAHTNSITEQTVVTVTPSQYLLFKGIWLDLSNLIKNTTIRAKQDINNTGTYLTFETQSYHAGLSNPGTLITRKTPGDGPIRITLESFELEGASRNISYEYFYTNLGAAPTT